MTRPGVSIVLPTFELELEQRAGAAQHLRRALRQDPRWLANRAVVGYLVRRAGAKR